MNLFPAITFVGMSITATVENGRIRLPEGIHLPDGTEVLVETLPLAPRLGGAALGESLADFVGIADDLPADLARNLDHYIHAAPKQP